MNAATVARLASMLAAGPAAGLEAPLGTIVAISGNELTVQVNGAPVDELRYLAGWTPAVGDTVLLLDRGEDGDPIVLGKLA